MPERSASVVTGEGDAAPIAGGGSSLRGRGITPDSTNAPASATAAATANLAAPNMAGNLQRGDLVDTARTIAGASMRLPGPAIRSSSAASRRSKGVSSSITELLSEARHQALET